MADLSRTHPRAPAPDALTTTHAIVRPPAQSMVHGITEAQLGTPDWALATHQFDTYCGALEDCGVTLTRVDTDEEQPDCVFIEDTALVTPKMAVATRPGAVSRRGEVPPVAAVLREIFPQVVEVEAPGTVDAGDIMNVDGHHFIGLSTRTNEAGASQVIAALQDCGLSGQTVRMPDILHFKTGINYLSHGRLIVAAGFLEHLRSHAAEFPRSDFELLVVPDAEAYAANALRVNERVLLASGYPHTEAMLRGAGYDVVLLDMSEFRKLDGGLSCLSLRF